MKLSSWIFLSTSLAFTWCAYAARGRNPCHPNRTVAALGTPCEVVRLPPNICSKCKLNNFDEQGIFDNCESIYNINNSACRAELQRYTQMNPCDDVRPRQLRNFNNPVNRVALDYFVYAVCEECCDCIPRGARPVQFQQRKARGKKQLTSIVRGNCPAHAHFDICRLWPQVRHLPKPGGRANFNLPKACPLLNRWFNSPASAGWNNDDSTRISRDVKRFLKNLNRAAGCRQRDTWQACSALETAQRRI